MNTQPQQTPRSDDEFPDRETAWNAMQSQQTPSEQQAESMGATEDDPRFPEVKSVVDRESSTDRDLTKEEAQETRYPGEKNLPPTQNEDEGAPLSGTPGGNRMTNAPYEQDVPSSGAEYSETHPESDDPRYPSEDRDQAYRSEGQGQEHDVLELLDRTNDTLIEEEGRPVIDDGEVIDSFESTASRARRALGDMPRASQNPPI